MRIFLVKDMHVGYTESELESSVYAPFYNPVLAPFPDYIREAILTGQVAHELMYPVERAADLQTGNDWPVENGYALTPEGSGRVFCRVDMPGVTPQMWQWWFGWHGSDPMRYRLWHPQAHVHVGWQDQRSDLDHYIGRTSNIVEYLGSDRMKLAITFVTPGSVGLDENKLAEAGEVAICGRVAFPGVPVDTGWLVHHIRPVPGGSEMRSRMWVGGNNIALRGLDGRIGTAVAGMLGRLQKISGAQAHSLFVHGYQEMAHLATFLPEIHEAFKAD
jgi:hypothetical protein